MNGAATYVIGIDLGTTNCTMAYAEMGGHSSFENFDIIQFPIPQITAPGVQSAGLSLPSFIYFPLKEELEKQKLVRSKKHLVGVYARERGGELPDRVIASAKSWLCHDGIDRRANLLPIEGGDDLEKMSPVLALAELLKHLKEAWDTQMTQAPFDKQSLFITVPASFDPGARQLIQESAALASYPEHVLLEEPQAAFYAWLYRHKSSWRKQLQVGDYILVVDVGGGTTDFSLISVEDDLGNLSLKRVAVGSHLLLGGDNMDHALAYFTTQKFEAMGHELDTFQSAHLVHLCRQAKEKLLSTSSPDAVTVTLQGKGSRLIGGSFSVQLTKEEVCTLLVDGFLPVVQPEDHSSVERRFGISQIGLPFAKDPRISCQLAKFLSMTGESDTASMERFIVPTAILFNGGTLKAERFQSRLMELLSQWAIKLKKAPPQLLDTSDLDFAVSQGAVYYGLSRHSHGLRIRGGTSHSYFIGIENAAPAIPGVIPATKALCVVPLGMEEGTEAEINQKEFSLLLGELATFRFFSHSTRHFANGIEPVVGSVVTRPELHLKELHPIETLMEKREGDGHTVKVRLKSKVTELGVLELWCLADDGRKWKLEFDVRPS